MELANITNRISKWIITNKDWLILIAGIISFGLIAGNDFVNDVWSGWNKGAGAKNSFEEMNSFEIFIEFSLISLCALGFISLCVYLFGELFYRIFFKYILQKNKLRNILAFIFWLLVFFNLGQIGLSWIFDKNNAFIDSNSKLTLSGYRDLYATFSVALSFVLIIAYSLVKNFITNTKIQTQLIVQKSQAELMALKAQINPHFLFNVLNNLYGSAIVEDSPKTSEGILQLSSIMRHVVEGTKNERIDVEKEIRFLNDYIELNKMRIPNRPNIRIVTEIFWDENPTMIAPLLVIPYLENAFKYGISTTEECFIEMSFRIENQQLSFVCKNSIIKTDDKLEVGTGTGLDNTKRRLDLYYPTAYQLSTSSSDNVFEVNLEVKL